MKMKKSLALYVLGGVFASALSIWRGLSPANENFDFVIAGIVLSSITSALGVLTSIALVVFVLCARKDKLAFLPPAVIGAVHVLPALALMLLPTARLAGIFDIGHMNVFPPYRLIAFGLLGGAAIGAGLGALTANLKIGLRMLILLGMALVVFLLSETLDGWKGTIVVISAFSAFMALYAAFDGKECGETEPVDEPVRPVQPVRMTAAPDEEALRALERLPKLRELGALSDEEYEQKKAELLERL